MEIWRWWNHDSGEIYYFNSREEGERLAAMCRNEWPSTMEHSDIELEQVSIMTAEEAFQQALGW
jgi:hypothetical protein